MIDCPFATATERGTMCGYTLGACRSTNPKECHNLNIAVEDFEEILTRLKEAQFSIEFMESVVKYGNKEK